MKYFIPVAGLAELEHKNDWEGCRKLLVQEVQDNPSSAPLLCRLIGECWLVLTNRFCMEVGPDVNLSIWKSTLVAATKYGLKNFSSDVNFLWQAGYMMILFPYYFCEGGENPASIEDLGRKMVKRANYLAPEDKVIQSVVLGFELPYKELVNARKPYQEVILNSLGTETELEQYFRDVLI